MKDIINVAKINEFFAQNGQIEYPKWVESARTSILPAWSALEGARFLEGTTAVIYHLNEIRDIIYNPMDHLVWHCKEFAEFAKMR